MAIFSTLRILLVSCWFDIGVLNPSTPTVFVPGRSTAENHLSGMIFLRSLFVLPHDGRGSDVLGPMQIKTEPSSMRISCVQGSGTTPAPSRATPWRPVPIPTNVPSPVSGPPHNPHAPTTRPLRHRHRQRLSCSRPGAPRANPNLELEAGPRILRQSSHKAARAAGQ